MDQKYIIALELSGAQVKGVAATVGMHPNGTTTLPTIVSIVSEDTSDCVQFGRVQNLINAGKLTNCVVRRLQSDPALQGGKIVGTYVALAGRSFGSEQATAELVLPSEMVITADTITELYDKASQMATQNKAVERVMPRRFVVDSQVMPNPVGALGTRLRGDFTLVTCNPINRRNLDMVFADPELAPVAPRSYITTPLALADMVLGEEDKQLGCVLVDLGYQTTTVSIYKDRALQFLATLPMGSQNITRDISVGMNVTMEKAEAAKCAQGDAQPGNTRGNDDMARMNSYVAARAYEIVANITNCINYAGFKPSDLPGGFVLAGRGSRLKNFDALLAAQSKIRVRHAEMPSGVNFALSTNTIAPEDYMSLVAMVLRISRDPSLMSCVSFASDEAQLPAEPEVTVTTPAQPRTPAQQPAVTPAQPAQQPVQPTAAQSGTRQVDDDKWDKDDPIDTPIEEEEKPKRANKKSGWGGTLKSLRDRFNKLVSADTLEDDTDLD